jgi:CRP/FNR family cyclic AMP-dependent transcriptional regulator
MSTAKMRKAPKVGTFDVQAFLDSAGLARTTVEFRAKDTIFSQGDLGKMLKAGDFIGEGVLARQPMRIATATAATPVTVIAIGLKEMIRVLHAEQAFSDRFIAYMVGRNIRIEEDLIDQLFNSRERRLARTLLLLARYGNHEKPQFVLPKISQETLAEMVGTTRSRVNFFMNKFKKLGFINYDGGLHVNDSLLRVVLHD